MTTQEEVRDAAFALGKMMAKAGTAFHVIDEIATGYAAVHTPTSDEADPLQQIVILQQIHAASQTIVGWRVDDAKEAGNSWADIGKALGMTRQAAHKRFGK